jgi:hypothetical protein
MTESDRDKTLEVMARALYEAVDYETPWKDVVARYPATYRDVRAQANAALTAYESHLLAVVPVAEIDALRHDLDRYITIASDLATEATASPYGKAVVKEKDDE